MKNKLKEDNIEENLENKEVIEENGEKKKSNFDEETIHSKEESFENDKNDELIDKKYLSSLIAQKDRLIYYEIEDIYSNEEKRTYKNRMKLRKQPPVLIVRDEFDNEVKFYLTENLTDELIETLNEIKRAYLGFSGPKDINAPKGFFAKSKYYIKNNPFKILSIIFVILFLLSLKFK